MATTSYGTPMVSNTMPNPTGMSTAPSTINVTSPMVMPVMPVTPQVSARASLPMTQTQTSTMTSTPTVSTVMSNPVAPTQTVSTPMTTTATTGPLVNRNMGLPLSSARPIEVTETTSNLEEIQNFPVIGRAADGTHFHQDPVSGQVYRMTEEFHQRIPEILRNRQTSNQEGVLNTGFTDISNVTIEPTTVMPTMTTETSSLVGGVNEFVDLFLQNSSDVTQLSVLGSIINQSNFSEFRPFTQPVMTIEQTPIQPLRIGDGYSIPSGIVQVLVNQNASQNISVNSINNTNNLSSEQVTETITLSNKPITKILTTNYFVGSDGLFMYNIPINKFYNTNKLIS